MAQKVTLYPISGLAQQWDDEPFDHSKLPTTIIPNVTIENVSAMFTDETWKWVEGEIGKRDLEALRSVRHAIVHRYESSESAGNIQQSSLELVANMAACLRLIRPMRQFALTISGVLNPDGTVQVGYFDHPIHLLEIPRIQKNFFLRNRDITELQVVAGEFLRAMRGEYWKFRMPVSLYEAGHFQDRFWKSRFILWCSAIEAVYTSQTYDRQHSGGKVAKARIKWFLGSTTKIYAPGDVPSFVPQPEPTIGNILDDLYEVRNCIAHGDRVPDRFFSQVTGTTDPANNLAILEEAASFIVRASLLKMLKGNLLEHFKGGVESQSFFQTNGLTSAQLP
jgi:hypothetical protein